MKLDEYASFSLTADMNKLSAKEKEMIPILIEVAKIMDELFWYEAYGDKETLMASLKDDAEKGFAKINYGPWDRLGDNAPFIDGVGEKPLGAQYYPVDMTKEEFEAFESDDKTSLYTFVRRNEDGELESKIVETVAGRVLFNQMVPEEVGYVDELLTKKKLIFLVKAPTNSWGFFIFRA